MLDLYYTMLVPFAQCLLSMERRGIYLDLEYLGQQEAVAEADLEQATADFRRAVAEGGWVDADAASSVLLSSSVQVGHLLFAKDGEPREFSVLNPLFGTAWVDIPGDEEPLTPTGRKRAKRHLKMKTIEIRGMGLISEKTTASGRPSTGGGIGRRRDCHFADNPSPSVLKNLPKGGGRCSRVTVSPTARRDPARAGQTRHRRARRRLGGRAAPGGFAQPGR